MESATPGAGMNRPPLCPSVASVRPPALAGLFYPRDAAALGAEVDALLAGTPQPDGAPCGRIRAVIAPHAGYRYSGPTAAAVYARLAPQRAAIRRVLLLGPAHRVPVRGLALPAAAAYSTPLGSVPVDPDAGRALAALPQVRESAAAHALEHSIEVHLPFLQRALDAFTLVPLVVGDASTAEVAEVISALWADDLLVIASSDLSHYLRHEVAAALDRDTALRILRLEPSLAPEQACGAAAINGLLRVAGQHGLRARLVDLRNSGDTAGERERVVGYGAFTFHEAP